MAHRGNPQSFDPRQIVLASPDGDQLATPPLAGWQFDFDAFLVARRRQLGMDRLLTALDRLIEVER